MANKVNVDLSMNVQGYVDGMNKATESTEKYETETRKISDAQVNLNKELKAAKREVQNLAAGFAKLDDEAKKSAFGQEMARQLQIAKEKAAEYIDLQGDLSTELKNMASDTATFDTLSDGLSALGSTMSAVTGVMGIFTDDTELMTKAVTYFTTAESIASAAIKVKNLLQKQSSLMLGITRVQQNLATAAVNLDTAAKGKNVIATNAATVAQKALNVAANANPYVLLATAVLGVASAFAIFSGGADEATEAQNKLTVAEENAKKTNESYTNALASEYSKLMTGYNKLKAQWAALENDNQRKKFIKDHKRELQELGGEINNVRDAEGFFTGDTSRIVAAFEKRAKAAALAAKMAELYRQEMEIIEKNNDFLQNRGYRAGEEARNVGSIQIDPGQRYAQNPTYNNGKYYMERGVLKYTEKGAEAANKATKEWQGLNDAYHKNHEEQTNILNDYTQLIKEGALLNNGVASYTDAIKDNTNAANSYEKEKINIENQYKNQLIDELSYKEKLANLEKTHLETLLKSGKATEADVARYQNAKAAYEQIKISTQYQDELNNAQTAYNHGILTEAEYLKKVADINKSIYEANLKNGTATEQLAQNYLKAKQAAVDASKTIRESLEDQLKAIEDKLSNGENLTVEVRTQLMQEANRIQEQLNKISATSDLTIPAKVEPKYVIKGSFEDIKQSVKNGIQEINDIADAYDLGIIDYDTAKKRIENINKQLVELGAKEYKIKIESEFGTQLQSFLDGAGEFSGVINSVDSVVGAFDRLNTAIKEGKSGWEQFVASVNVAMSIIQSISTVMTILNSIQDAMNITTEASATIKAKDTAATIASATAADVAAASTGTLAAANTAAVAPMIALATATKKLAAAQIFQAHASIPFVGPPAAAAGVAMMEATLAAIQAFANGGIVNGSSYSGDKVIARVNSGEMILNKRQQQNLFNLLDYGSTTHSNANIIPEVKIKGSDLYIAFRNYSSKESKLGKNIGIH